jgi:hypothetical protein
MYIINDSYGKSCTKIDELVGFFSATRTLLYKALYYAKRIRRTIFLKIFLSYWLTHFNLMNKFAIVLYMHKPTSQPFFERSSNHPINMKCIIPAFFRDRIGGKEGGLRIYKPSSQNYGNKINFCA